MFAIHSNSDGSNHSKLPNRYETSTRTRKSKSNLISTATAHAIAAVAADKNRKQFLSQSGLITLERAKPRKFPTTAERQFAMNENLRRFLSSLPEFPIPPEELDDDQLEPKLLKSENFRPVAEGKNIIFEAKCGSQPNLNKFEAENHDEKHEKFKKVSFWTKFFQKTSTF